MASCWAERRHGTGQIGRARETGVIEVFSACVVLRASNRRVEISRRTGRNEVPTTGSALEEKCRQRIFVGNVMVFIELNSRAVAPNGGKQTTFCLRVRESGSQRNHAYLALWQNKPLQMFVRRVSRPVRLLLHRMAFRLGVLLPSRALFPISRKQRGV